MVSWPDTGWWDPVLVAALFTISDVFPSICDEGFKRFFFVFLHKGESDKVMQKTEDYAKGKKEKEEK